MKKPTVVVTNRVFPETLSRLSAHCEVIAHDGDEPLSAGEVVHRCSEADAVMAFMPDCIDSEFIAACPRLKIVACALKGFDNFDVDACTRNGTWVSIVPDLLTEPTAELAIGLAIGLGRFVAEADRQVRSGRFQGWRPAFYGTSIDGSTVSIFGAGRVGTAIARKLAGFSCRILMTDCAPPVAAVPANARLAVFEQALSEGDFLILALPLNASTLHLFDAARLARCKRGALLINPARGSLVDEAAVAVALASGQLAGYAADVFELEDWARTDRPRSVDSRLLAADARTLFTTHIGSAVERVRREIELDAADNIIEALSGRRPHGAVNTPVRAAAPESVRG